MEVVTGIDSRMFGELWQQMGAIAILVVFMFFMICKFWEKIEKMDKIHQEERCKWSIEHTELSDKLLSVIEQNTKAIMELTLIIKEKYGHSVR